MRLSRPPSEFSLIYPENSLFVLSTTVEDKLASVTTKGPHRSKSRGRFPPYLKMQQVLLKGRSSSWVRRPPRLQNNFSGE